MTTPDLIEVLRDIQARAAEAHKHVVTGAIPSGSSALRTIAVRASDAIRWAEDPEHGAHEPAGPKRDERRCPCASGRRWDECHGRGEIAHRSAA